MIYVNNINNEQVVYEVLPGLFSMTYNEARSFGGLNSILENPKWPLAKACAAVEECVLSNKDNLRGFFEQCFPTLLRRLFGYDGVSWLTSVAKGGKEADAKALLRLLAPTGVLFSACYAADADGLIRFVFPSERLPTHTQMMLAAASGRQELERWPQYAGAVVYDAGGRPHIHLGVFQYFVFWAAFYVLKGGDLGAAEAAIASRGPGLGDSMRKAADVLHLTRGGRESDLFRHPYMALLRQFLLDWLPRPATQVQMAAAGSPSKAGTPFFRGGAAQRQGGTEAATPRGLTFYSTLLEFWLTDGDEPVPLASTADFATRTPAAPQTPLTPLWSTTYEPPSEDLLEALGELVKYVTCVDSGSGAPQPAQAAISWLPLAPVHTVVPLTVQQGRVLSHHLAGPPRLGAAAQPPAQAFARRLFRFFHRAFTMWPDQRSVKPMLRAFLAYLAPWRTASAAPALAPGGFAAAPGHSPITAHLTAHVSDLVHRVHWTDTGKGPQDGTLRYRREWENHVLSNLPFYTLLLPLFLELCVARLEVRGESAAQDLVAVMSVLEEAPELRELLGRVERDYNKYIAMQPRRADGPFAELLPWLAEQAYDWEVAATVNVMGDTPLLRSSPGFALMTAQGVAPPAATKGEASAAAAHGSAALTARDLLHISSHLLKREVHGRLKACLETALPLGQLPREEDAAAAHADAVEAAQYEDVVPRLPRSSWRDVRYKGDPLTRPIASFELGLLVRLLVALSMSLNAWLGLDRPWSPEEDPPENRFQEFLVRLRRRGKRFNLRPLADRRSLAWLPILWFLLYYVYRLVALVVWALRAVPTPDLALASSSGAAVAREAQAQQGQHAGWAAGGRQQHQQHDYQEHL